MIEEGKYITVCAVEYEELKSQALFADALEAAGVDNWEGFDEAIEIWNELRIEKYK